MIGGFARKVDTHALDIDLDGLSLSVEEVSNSNRHNLDDCVSTVGTLSTAGCWGSASSFGSVISCGS